MAGDANGIRYPGGFVGQQGVSMQSVSGMPGFAFGLGLGGMHPSGW